MLVDKIVESISVFRAVCSWVEVPYALNRRYLMNEKGALKWIDGFVPKPIDMEARVMNLYKHFADGETKRAYQILDELHNEIEVYRMKFWLPSLI